MMRYLIERQDMAVCENKMVACTTLPDEWTLHNNIVGILMQLDLLPTYIQFNKFRIIGEPDDFFYITYHGTFIASFQRMLHTIDPGDFTMMCDVCNRHLQQTQVKENRIGLFICQDCAWNAIEHNFKSEPMCYPDVLDEYEHVPNEPSCLCNMCNPNDLPEGGEW